MFLALNVMESQHVEMVAGKSDYFSTGSNKVPCYSRPDPGLNENWSSGCRKIKFSSAGKAVQYVLCSIEF